MTARTNIPKGETVDEAFSDVAHDYDQWVQKALPGYNEIFDTAIELIPYRPEKAIEVLDLGAGTGLFCKHVLEAFLNASFVLYDLSDEMLEVARKRLAASANRFEYIQGDLVQVRYRLKFDLVISSMSIHHIGDQEKQVLCRRIYQALRPGGAFINVDQIKGVGRFGELYWTTWLRKVREAGAEEKHIQKSIDRRRKFDQEASLLDQLDWMKMAGFQADCVYKNYFVGVFLALKPARDG
tara:strand:- start:1305 stop:2021 length:717 start_codon:yes stop_codon:yes gene_type:complete